MSALELGVTFVRLFADGRYFADVGELLAAWTGLESVKRRSVYGVIEAGPLAGRRVYLGEIYSDRRAPAFYDLEPAGDEGGDSCDR